MTKVSTVGVISDTHGLLRPEAVAALRGVSAIVHAGDIGSPEILKALSALAPMTAVRGNNDREPWAKALPVTAVVEIGGVRLYVLHDVKELDLDPGASGFAAVLSGHSHQPRSEQRQGVLYFNPGSAGPRRFRLPVCVGRLTVESQQVRGRIVELAIPVSQLTPRNRKAAAGDREGARASGDSVGCNSDRAPDPPRGWLRRSAGRSASRAAPGREASGEMTEGS